MMVTARRLDSAADEVRYAFGFEDRFDRVLIIDPHTLEARAEEGDFDGAASVITAKIVKMWRSSGEFPTRAMFAG
ncbi:hypothetical protein [Micromonospora endolithica]|nr:hypothetical protein [Micromonospora endolithica]